MGDAYRGFHIAEQGGGLTGKGSTWGKKVQCVQ